VGVAGLTGSSLALNILNRIRSFALANAGHDTRAVQAYLGHANIAHAVRYTELAPHWFRHFWND
jgi:site-specific recombinase XerD